jgi:hypothetical protein
MILTLDYLQPAPIVTNEVAKTERIRPRRIDVMVISTSGNEISTINHASNLIAMNDINDLTNNLFQ